MDAGRAVDRLCAARPHVSRAGLRIGCAGILLVLCAYLVLNSLYFHPYVVDDAFISLRYATNLVDGLGLVYNPGQRVEGYSNFAWVLLEALLLRLGWPPLEGVKLVGLVSALGVLLSTSGLAGLVFAGQPLARAKALVAAALVGLNTSLALWSQAGLESALFALLVVTACWGFEREQRRPRPVPWSALVFGLAWLVRPDAPVFLLYFGLRRLSVLRQRPWSRADVWWLLLLAAIVVPYEVWGWSYYGRLLPMTHAAKAGAGEGWWARLAGVADQRILGRFVARQGWGLPALLALGAAGCVLGRRRVPGGPAMMLLAGLVGVVYVRVDWMPRHRFMVPLLPLLAVLVAHGLGELLLRARAVRWGAGVVGLVSVLALADYARFQMFGGEAPRPHQPTGAGQMVELAPRGLWFARVPQHAAALRYHLAPDAALLLRITPPGETICLRDIGLVGQLTMNPIWDTCGLVTPAVARARHSREPALEREMFHDLRAARPGVVFVHRSSRGTSIDDRIAAWLETDAEALAQYRWLPLRAGSDLRVALYVRRDLPRVDVTARVREARARFARLKLPWPNELDRHLRLP